MDTKFEHKKNDMFYVENGSSKDYPYLKYTKDETADALDFVETYVPEDMRGQGLAGGIVTHAMEYAVAKGFLVIPTCPYVQSFLEKHDEYSHFVKVAEEEKT